MTQILASFVLVSLFAATPVLAAAKSDKAELCFSVDGRHQIVQPFGGEIYLVTASGDRTVRPTVKDKQTYTKAADGRTEKNVVDFAMFELIAETFGGIARPKSEWKATYEELYDGNITVSDETGAVVGTFPMTCNAALIEFN